MNFAQVGQTFEMSRPQFLHQQRFVEGLIQGRQTIVGYLDVEYAHRLDTSHGDDQVRSVPIEIALVLHHDFRTMNATYTSHMKVREHWMDDVAAFHFMVKHDDSYRVRSSMINM